MPWQGVAIALLGFSAVTDVAHLADLPVRAVEIAPRVVQRVARRPSEGSAVARAARLLLKLVRSCGASAIVRGIDAQHEADWWRSAGSRHRAGRLLRTPRGTR